MIPSRTVDVQPLDPHRFRLGEGGRWDGTDFWQVDLLDGDLWRSPGGTGELQQVLDLDVPLGAMAPTAAGELIVIAGDGVAAVGADGSLDFFGRPVEGREPPRRVNDAAVSAGRMYFGTMDFPGEIGNGELWRVDPDGTISHLLDGLGCPNGPAVSPDGQTLYLADSSAFLIRRYPLHDDGTLGDGTDFVTFEEDFGKPDGMTVDDDGHLWVAVWGGASVVRFNPDGGWADRISVPVRQPTSVTILPGRMLVTSASDGLAEPGELDGATLALPCEVTAAPAGVFG